MLVIIDDLDRRKPAYMIKVARGLLTALRPPEAGSMLLGNRRRLGGPGVRLDAEAVA